MPSVLFAGGGAVSAAAASSLPDSVRVGVASRSPGGAVEVLHARRLRPPRTGRVRPIGYPEAAGGSWDLVVLSTRPSETDPSVLAFASDAAPIVATTSQVPGDLDILAATASTAIILAPAFLADATSRDPLRVTAWQPRRALFSIAGDEAAVRAVTSMLPGTVTPTDERSILASAARTMPFMAELVVHGGDWRALTRNLRRPARASAEAVGSVTDARSRRSSPALARAALASATALAPFDLPAYAAGHFTRHAEQTLAMLDAWRALRPAVPTPALDALREALAGAIE
ncbi:hypothetical protein P0W64_21050 [Tsukamurella sp. 8F]|uniref:hypothetical protein n=1 Tax=unclassified Tsukamurella TaxID=2633480 RepID=UPI0023B93907|nr:MULTISPECIES: hypothetical protein [unclassified Tsukamurella]MDF0531030.1 hypothetical protein [Tsukamurella sp. 8J]MDF0589273.1 hypothetical protein [Tsukamurella sp. 8F]